ncbi:MAG TPA: hypothetical protein VJQ84_09620 [Solirubrobacterales bacterium]|nr:hypothetical protein [Solirubrobacterales bacterium]
MLLAGCGGGGDDSGGDKTISKQEFIAKADAICKKGTERMQVAFLAGIKGTANLTKVSKAEQEKLVGSAIVPSVEREVKELRSIGIPDGDEEKVDAMIGALEEGAETAKRDPGAVADSSDAVFGIASRIAGEYGLKDCGIR